MADPFDIILAAVRTGLDMSLRQIAILRICQTEIPEGRQVKSLAESLLVSRPVVSRAGDVLEELGFVERAALSGDRRTCFLTITKKGSVFLANLAGDQPRKSAPSAAPGNRRRSNAQVAA